MKQSNRTIEGYTANVQPSTRFSKEPTTFQRRCERRPSRCMDSAPAQKRPNAPMTQALILRAREIPKKPPFPQAEPNKGHHGGSCGTRTRRLNEKEGKIQICGFFFFEKSHKFETVSSMVGGEDNLSSYRTFLPNQRGNAHARAR